jgi:hypothetical protein
MQAAKQGELTQRGKLGSKLSTLNCHAALHIKAKMARGLFSFSVFLS